MAAPFNVSTNRTGSAMIYVEETYHETKERAQKRIKQYEDAQHTRTPFQIGNVDRLGGAISRLDEKYKTRPKLAIDCEPGSELDLRKPARQLHFGRPETGNKSMASGKPKLVELHQYPGFDANGSTPLPNDVSSLGVLKKVTNAQPKHYNQSFLKDFEDLFYSDTCQTLLQDIFWWLFLQSWQPKREHQCRLFDRVAHSYVNIVVLANRPYFQDIFLNHFPMLMSQAVYAAFCECFIDSYTQFDAKFKDDICNVVYEWTTGIRPVPMCWTSWNFAQLEPSEITARKNILHKTATLKADRDNFVAFPTDTALLPPQKLADVGRRKTIQSKTTDVGKRKPCLVTTPQSVSYNVTSSENRENASMNVNFDSVLSGCGPATKSSSGIHSTTSRKSSTAGVTESCTSHVVNPVLIESHPIGRGPDFTRSCFNINGRSPLVAHYLATRDADSRSSVAVLVDRIEIQNMPPPGSQTYREVMRQSFRKIREVEQSYNRFYEGFKDDNVRFANKMRRDRRELKLKQAALLGKPREVHQLSNLIVRELKGGQPMFSKTAQQAIQTALETA